MANNVNCEDMRFVIRNLVMLKILPGNGAKIFLDGSWNYVGISPEREGLCSTTTVGISLSYETKVSNQ